jgi:hypothetical protein
MLAPLPALLLVLSCGSSKLEKSTAEKLLKPDYPAVLTLRVPLQTKAVEKGSAEDQKFQKINQLLAEGGWFEAKAEEKDGKVRYRYRTTPKAPGSVKAGLENYETPAAALEFVGATRMEPMDSKGNSVKVTFLVKVAKPSPVWPVYELTHENVKLGQPVERHARFERSGGKWGLMETDEKARLRQ